MEELNSYDKGYFILMAHIEQRSGFLKECDGGLIESLAQKTYFKNSVLGFQKGRTRDKIKQLEQWMGYKLPYIEGSDCKSIDEIGKGDKKCYVKIGDSNFDSVALAFKDFKNRISLEKSTSSHGFIRSVEFLGGKLDGKKIYLSPELNCLIGIRGSGKSSIIEAIRYALDIPPSNSDNDYKREVVKNLLGSGGQVILELQDNYGNLYRIKRILGEDPHVTDMDDKGVGAKIGSILSAPLYFGQKDLSAMDNGFELTLLDKIVGEVSGNFETQISNIEERISSKMKGFINLENKINNGGELEKDLSDIKHKIKIFEEKGLSDKLSKQVNFQQDKATIDNVNTLVGKYIQALQNIISSEELSMLIKLEKSNSQEVPELFEKLRIEIKKVTSTKNKIEEIIQEVKDSKSKLVEFSNEMNNTITSLEEEFAEIKREIDIPNLNPDDFSALKLRETKIEEAIEKIDQQENEKNKLVVELNELVQERNDTLLKELEIYKNEINRINQSQTSLKLHITFKGDKKEFLTQLKDSFKGTSVSTSSYEQITGKFPDFTSLVIDILLKDSEKISQILPDTHLTKVKQRVREEYSSYLKHKTPNNITINYHGKPITNHSIGQRASALVLFILSQKNNNLIMIDQPEDDLDNQVIYNEIIKEIKSRKPDVQFIFATHNANIPVLGDSEQIISVSYDDEGITTDTGSIDSKLIQNKIVDIMEGGHEAFNRRTEIYNLWRN
ncbi:hypothetical protein AFZ15_15235 [Listeria monocytogenes]|uniref:AAA family ATPase n=2 Tax=Listeria monocytogenes TaxID=1639 RepID=A0A3T1TCW6_LISMN|nr:hypothetical protein [Listeria monocytogenes]EAG6275655.1 hypothetical protein [Listeria monocytogenes CFSAN003808]EAG6281867.1 hypothetical protein [Listeria monocytogenes CFSAN003809]EAG6291258.1 hypothetical protein [Listeria monocytogenes CFSAN003825]EAG6318512.1 hypothetical protein [Listeria monocytogenes CFSAN003824]EAG6342757.1 hypothetical protein [Listeria monocytogenes CFSAN003811]EHF3620774.1 hypothetical protein [Listeria innocua]MDA44583.1 hypothetical protein [Listeria mono